MTTPTKKSVTHVPDQPPVEEEVKELSYKYFKDKTIAHTHHFYIDREVGCPEDYTELVHAIKYAPQHDLVYIYLNTPGGQINTGVQIINAMRSSAATVITVLESEAHSLGTMIFLAGDEFVVHDNCRMMFHNYSGGTYGKGHEVRAEIESTDSWIHNLIRDVYEAFLTEPEIDRLIKGEDFWMESAEIKKRLDRVMIRKSEKDKELMKQQAALMRLEAQRIIEEANALSPVEPEKAEKIARNRRTVNKV